MLPDIPSLCCCDDVAAWLGGRISIANTLFGWSPFFDSTLGTPSLPPKLFRKARFASHTIIDGASVEAASEFEFFRYGLMPPDHGRQTTFQSVFDGEKVLPGQSEGQTFSPSPEQLQVRSSNTDGTNVACHTLTLSQAITYDEQTRELAELLPGLPYTEKTPSFEDTPDGNQVSDLYFDFRLPWNMFPDGQPVQNFNLDPFPRDAEPRVDVRGAWLMNKAVDPIEWISSQSVPRLLVPTTIVKDIRFPFPAFRPPASDWVALQSPRIISIAKWRGPYYRGEVILSSHSFPGPTHTDNPLTWTEAACSRTNGSPNSPTFFETSGLQFIPAGDIWPDGLLPHYSLEYLRQIHFPVVRRYWRLVPDPNGTIIDPSNGLPSIRVPADHPPETPLPPTSC